MIVCIPENLDLDLILSEHPPDFTYKKEHFIYILHLLTDIPANRKDLVDDNGNVPINAKFLQNHIHNYKQYLEYLKKLGILESTPYYIPNERSRGYRFTEKYQTINKEILIPKPFFRPSTRFRKSRKNRTHVSEPKKIF